MEITLDYDDMKTILNSVGGIQLYTKKAGNKVARVYPWVFGASTPSINPVMLPEVDLTVAQFTSDFPGAILVEKII